MGKALPVIQKYEVLGNQTAQFAFPGLQELPHHRCGDALFLHLQDAAPGLIRMENNLPIIDYAAGGPAAGLTYPSWVSAGLCLAVARLGSGGGPFLRGRQPDQPFLTVS